MINRTMLGIDFVQGVKQRQRSSLSDEINAEAMRITHLDEIEMAEWLIGARSEAGIPLVTDHQGFSFASYQAILARKMRKLGEEFAFDLVHSGVECDHRTKQAQIEVEALNYISNYCQYYSFLEGAHRKLGVELGDSIGVTTVACADCNSSPCECPPTEVRVVTVVE